MSECCLRSGMCDFQMYGNLAVIDCPCKKCLVKPVCIIICDLLNNHHMKIFGFDHDEVKNNV